ncbi:MAG TPA: MBL fold metallo-hydrolase, partial [Solirubrobacteraceae bacterium]|nr:MBL fold metallo-hydrolase [Solirubrobacteraceae bacterium]
MIVESSEHPQFLSNTYLVADGQGGPGFFVDAGGPVEPLIEAGERLGVTPTHVLLTHHHYDHVSEVGGLRARWPGLEVLISPLERDLLGGETGAGADGAAADMGTIEAGQTLSFGALEVRPLHTPGHTAGMLSFLVGEASASESAPPAAAGTRKGSSRSAAPGGFAGGNAVVFTGDTLFKNSVGGVKAPGHTTYTDLRDSIMGTLMELPPETIIYPGHAEPTSVGREWESNGFIRVWRGLDPQGSEPCTALGQP